MATERKLKESRHEVNAELRPDSLANMTKQDKVPEMECSRSCTSSSTCSLTNTTANVNNRFRQESISEPGNSGTNTKVYSDICTYARNNSKTVAKGLHSDHKSDTRYINSYSRYTNGNMMGVEGNYIGPEHTDSIIAPQASTRSRHLTSMKTSGIVDAEVPLNPKSFISSPSSNLSKYSLQNQHFKFSNKVPQLGSDFRVTALSKGSYYARSSSFPSNQVHGLFTNGSSNFRQNGTGYEVYKMGEVSNRNSNFETSKELSRGPRSLGVHAASNTVDEKEIFGPRVRRDRYNRSDFQIKYDSAKFFIIKSYSEDDIHKSIKYDVWSSTPNGNRKLNAAFLDAEMRYSEKGYRCPIFLFFSVNGSGQFLGLAEMIGPVDFEKDMDFWQQDKWSGFFPVTWHIIKDIPNNRLRHIILENNDNKPVTYTRDTQEVGIKQGLEMLSIFKNFSSTTSMLDDYKFYEEKEKLLQFSKSRKKESPDFDNYGNEFTVWNFEARSRRAAEQEKMKARSVSDSYTTLASLARKLSLNEKTSNPRKG